MGCLSSKETTLSGGKANLVDTISDDIPHDGNNQNDNNGDNSSKEDKTPPTDTKDDHEPIKTAAVPIHRECFDSQELMKLYPPIYCNKGKQEIFKLIAPNGYKDCKGNLIYSNYEISNNLPLTIPNPIQFIKNKVIIQPNIYEYINLPSESHFYVNFADPNLFGFYQGSLFAQDEIMTMEHPILCSLREKLGASYNDKNSKLTPFCTGAVIILNAIKHGNFKQNNLNKIYGRKFRQTSIKKLLKLVDVCKPPIYDNIICIACLSGSKRSKYQQKQLESIFKTAYCGFNGAKSEIINQSLNEEEKKIEDDVRTKKVVIHSGNWGCGAFGGNIEVHTILQIITAVIAKVDMFYYHSVDKKSMKKAQNACKVILNELYPKCKNKFGDMDTKQFISELYGKCYCWGKPNGT